MAEVTPDKMNIIQLRQYAKSKGIEKTGRMRKVDILSALGLLKLEPVSETPVPAPVAPAPVAPVVPVVKTPGVNLTKLRASVKQKINAVDNPELLLQILNLLN